MLVGQNKDMVIDFVGDFVRANLRLNQDRDMMFDHSEITLALAELEDEVDTMART